MPRPKFLIPFVIIILAATALAQGGEAPDFGSPGGVKKAEAEAKPQEEPRPVGDRALIERLSRWPDLPAQEAARALVLGGGRVVPLLLENLGSNDWRIRSGVAWALGELREQAAFPDLARSAHDIVNRINPRPFFDAMVKIDPVKATAQILPFIGSADARVAKEAFEALPMPLATEFEARIAELAHHDEATVRQRALILTRRLAKPAETDVHFAALADPSPRVACEARDFLADRDDEGVIGRLRALAFEGAFRPAGYAFLALVMIEDRTSRVLLDESAELKKRLLVFLNLKGEFENAVGAIAFANVSMRSTDPEIRAFADGAMMDILLGTAAGGLIYRDYAAVKSLCFRKAAQISGENFGEDGDRWLAWWRDAREGFRARRELKRLEADDRARMLFRYNRRAGDLSISLAIRMGEPGDDMFQVIRPIYASAAQMDALCAAMERLGFFERRGMQRDAGWTGDFVDVSVTVDAAEFRRSHYGPAPDDLLELERTVLEIAAAERWQAFFGSRPAGDFGRWFREQRAKLDAARAGSAVSAKEMVADLALEAYTGLAPQARREALLAWRWAGEDWIAAAMPRLQAVLSERDFRADRAGELLALLAERPGAEVTASVVAALPLFDAEGRKALLQFLDRRPAAELVTLDVTAKPELGSLLLQALARRAGTAEVDARLIDLLADPDPRVRQALDEAFPETAPEPLLGALRAAIVAGEGSRRFRLIEIYGRLSPADDLGDLESWFAAGSLAQKQAVVRALAAKDGERAWDRLFELARRDEARELRLEAQGAIATSRNPAVRQRMRAALADEKDEQRLLELFRVAAELFHEDAEVELGAFLGSESDVLRRQAAILLAPRLVTAAIPELLRMLLDKTESGRAWEYLELVTCREFPAISAEEAYVAYERFWTEKKEEEQSRWFMAALESQGMPSSNLLGYLNGNKRDLRSIALLLKALESEKWYVRANAHIHLGRIRGEPLGSLDRASTPAEIERIRNRWAEWYKALLADL